MRRPEAGEYPSFFESYISLTRGVDPIQNIEDSTLDIVDLLQDLPPEKHHYAYAEGKWGITQMLRHLMDADQVFMYRALYILRYKGGELSGFDHTLWAEHSLEQDLKLPHLLEEFQTFRKFAVQFFQDVTEAQWDYKGKVDGNILSLRSLPFIISGHALHHANILRNRYL